MQFSKAGNVVQAFKAMVAAEAISSSDGKKLTAFTQQSDSDDDDMNSPAAAVYETSDKQPPILDALNGFLDMANGEFESARQAEKSAHQNFEMVRMRKTGEVSGRKVCRACPVCIQDWHCRHVWWRRHFP